MAKKTKDDIPNPNNVTNRDILQRMNFLYQASALLNHINANTASASFKQPQEAQAPSNSSTVNRESSRKRKRQSRLGQRHPKTCEDLSKNYVQSMKAIGLKTNVRIDPNVKRTLCKKCNIILIPGSTAHVRVHTNSSHGNAVIYTCLSCKSWRHIPAPPVLSPEDVEALASTQPTQPAEPQDQEGAMPVDSTSKASAAIPESIANVPRKKQKHARLAPLFERKVGHVVFRGNERLPDDE